MSQPNEPPSPPPPPGRGAELYQKIDLPRNQEISRLARLVIRLGEFIEDEEIALERFAEETRRQFKSYLFEPTPPQREWIDRVATNYQEADPAEQLRLRGVVNETMERFKQDRIADEEDRVRDRMEAGRNEIENLRRTRFLARCKIRRLQLQWDWGSDADREIIAYVNAKYEW